MTATDTCGICSRTANVYRCSQCATRACEQDFAKRETLCGDCAHEAGIRIHRNSILHPIFH